MSARNDDQINIPSSEVQKIKQKYLQINEDRNWHVKINVGGKFTECHSSHVRIFQNVWKNNNVNLVSFSLS